MAQDWPVLGWRVPDWQVQGLVEKFHRAKGGQRQSSLPSSGAFELALEPVLEPQRGLYLQWCLDSVAWRRRTKLLGEAPLAARSPSTWCL
jgi:hypothetical protein